MWLAELHFGRAARSCPRRSASPARLPRDAPYQDRHRRTGTAAVPSAAAGRGSRDRRSAEPRPIDFGVGRSGVAQTYEAYGCPMPRAATAFAKSSTSSSGPGPSRASHTTASTTASMRSPWCQSPTRSRPADPHRRQHPRHFPAIGRRGAPIFASVRHTNWSDLARQIQTYHNAWQAAGHPGRGQVFVSAPTYIAETEERTRSEPKKASCISITSRRICWKAPRGWSIRRRPLDVCGGSSSAQPAIEDGLRDHALVGTPDSIVERLKTLRQEMASPGTSPNSIAVVSSRIIGC